MTETGQIEAVYLPDIFGRSSAISAAHRAYTARRHLVLTATAAVLALSIPASAQEVDTLAEFQARCLTPMVEVRQTDVTGLTRIPHRAAWESWVLDGRDWELRRALPDAVVQYCAIHGAFGEEVGVWADAAVVSGDWVRLDRVPETLQSVFIREPVIEFEIDREAPSLTVIETNLES